MNFRRTLIALLFVSFIISCNKDVEDNKLYVVSVASKQLHVLNASSLMSVLAQPLDFSGVGTPKKLGINPALHQLLMVLDGSNTLIRIGTEPPFSYSPLAFTNYGTGEPIVNALGNAAQKTNYVLTTKRLFLINEFGAPVFNNSTTTPTSTVVASPTATPTATVTPTPSPTVTPTPVSTPLTTGNGGSVTLPSGCSPSDLVNNVAVEVKKTSSSTISSSSPSPTTSPNGNASDSSSSDNNSFGAADVVTYVGGTEVLVACRNSNQVLIYQGDTLSLIASISLASNAFPFAVSFLRTAGETGSTVSGTYAIWNGNGTLELISSTTHSRLSGSPYSVTGSGTGISSFASNPDRSYFLTGYGSAGGAFVDVRDGSGTALSGSPFTLSSDCAGTGPAGLSSFAQTLKLSQSQKDANQPDTDFLIYYTCPSTGLVAALTTNYQMTFLTRTLGAQTAPKQLITNTKQEVVYVSLTGTTAPAPGIVALNAFTFADAFTPVTALTFTTGSPDQMLVIP